MQSGKMDFVSFQRYCRCSLSDAIAMVRKDSGKEHAFIAVDEVARVDKEIWGSTDVFWAPFRQLVTGMTILSDRTQGNRVNFVSSSLESYPIRELGVAGGRKCMARILQEPQI